MDSEEIMDIKIKQEFNEEVTCEDNEATLVDASVSNGTVKLEDKVKKELREEFNNEIDDNTEYLCEQCKTYFPYLSSLQLHMQNNDSCDIKLDVKSPNNSVNFDAMQNTEVKEASVEGNHTEKPEYDQVGKCNKKKTERKRQRTEVKDNGLDSVKDEHENDKRELVNLIMKDHIILRKRHHNGVVDKASIKSVKEETEDIINENDNDEHVNLVMKDHITFRINNPAEKSIFMKMETCEETSRNSMCGKSNIHAKTSDGHNQINNELCETTHDTIINVIGDTYDDSSKGNASKCSNNTKRTKAHASKKLGTKNIPPESSHMPNQFEASKKLKTHVSNSRKRGVSCNVCKKTFSRRDHLTRHMKRVHFKTKVTGNTPSLNQKHVCTFCDKSYESVEKLKSHLYNTHKSHVFCDVCKKTFTHRSSLARHVKRIHLKKNTTSPNQNHVCTLCDKSYETRDKFNRHLYNAHKGAVFCDYCSKKFSCKNHLERHMKKVHLRIEKTENTPSLNRKLVCTFCDKSYESGEKLKIHLYNVHKGPVFCDYCSKKFSRKNHLERHMIAVHLSLNEYECKFCEKKYFDKSGLNRHTRIYCTKNKPVTCKLCSTKYASQKKLETHMADHPRFICDYCDKMYYVRNYLQTHIDSKHMKLNELSKVKRNERKLCKVCRTKLSQKTFEMHMADHPTFICDYCNKVFYIKKLVLRHIKGIHLRVRHRCKKCGNKYAYMYLKRHMKCCKGNIK